MSRVDHGLLLGTRDDDHPQYYNAARLSSWWSGRPPNAHTHLEADITDLGSYSLVGHTHLEADITDLGSYALATHNHDGVYAPTHSHPYASDSHTHSYLPLSAGSSYPLTGDLHTNGIIYIGSDDYLQYADSSDWWRVVLDNGERFRVSNTQIATAGGSVTTPGLAFLTNGDLNTGIFRKAEGQTGIASDGAQAAYFDHDGVNGWIYTDVLSVTNEVQLPGNGSGSVTDPVLALGDGDTGIWEPADDVLEITAWGLARLIVDARSSYRGVFVVNSGFGVGLSGVLLSNNVIYNTPPTTSGSAKNAHWGLASGSIYYLLRDTSSRRYKRDIESWVPDFELEDLNVVQFTGSKATPVHDGSGVPIRGDDGEPLWEREWDDHLSYGLVAEEAYEVHPGLVTYDDDGAPDGIVWDLVTVRMIKDIVALKREVAELRRAA